MNDTISDFLGNSIYAPPKECFDWCLAQKVVGYHNIEVQVLLIAAAALAFIIIGDWLKEYPQAEKYAKYPYYFAKLSLYFFFYIYFFYVKGGV